MQVQPPRVGRIEQRGVGAELEAMLAAAAAVVAGEAAAREPRDAVVDLPDARGVHGAATLARMPLISAGAISWRRIS